MAFFRLLRRKRLFFVDCKSIQKMLAIAEAKDIINQLLLFPCRSGLHPSKAVRLFMWKVRFNIRLSLDKFQPWYRDIFMGSHQTLMDPNVAWRFRHLRRKRLLFVGCKSIQKMPAIAETKDITNQLLIFPCRSGLHPSKAVRLFMWKVCFN